MADSSDPRPRLKYDAYAHHGRNIILNHFSTNFPDHENMPLPPMSAHTAVTAPLPVGILGAGAGGLYTALILQDLDIPYRILEARERVGGRLFTYSFPDSTGQPYNYYDVGAMRFPKTDFMERVFKLFNYPPFKGELKNRLQPYYFVAEKKNAFLDYNGVTKRQDEPRLPDPFKAADVITSENKQQYISAGYDNIVKDVITPFATGIFDDLKNHTDKGWKMMMADDKYSTRAYMSIKYSPTPSLGLPAEPLPNDVVNWCETFDKSTGWYDRALSETVLESIAFGWQPGPDPPPVDWFCIDGGAQQIAECMKNYIISCNPDVIMYNSEVKSVKLNADSTMDVTTSSATHHEFSHVISTLPLGVLRMMDLTKAELSPMQSNALRELTYSPSTKIGMQFKTAWWTKINKLGIVGGQSFTDRPIRTIVYPSFGKVQKGETTTLIASYCWTDDAIRLASMMGKNDETLKEQVLRDLAVIHDVEIDFLHDQLIGYKAWSWSHDPHTMGCFAFFGPAKFGSLYTSLTTPAANGHLHFAGEAISTRHAWVEGALDSAWRAVAELLTVPGSPWADRLKKFYDNWGVNPEWVKETDEHGLPVLKDGEIDRQNDLILKHMMLTHPALFNL
ncbi:flavin containing amine oxidase [Rhizoctonia solani 123E]|uniref:Flavin containing amine oxidase n=1 Tax=Rhizoctonia solani 123E TaxID=1423351 RepID=A0A074S700_9AGAM|nr:flavin containing amine oxidase [Rhizoctonia solani 123E]